MNPTNLIVMQAFFFQNFLDIFLHFYFFLILLLKRLGDPLLEDSFAVLFIEFSAEKICTLFNFF